jgi:hypothetical protein
MKDNQQELADQDQKPTEYKAVQHRQAGKDPANYSPVGTTGANFDPTNSAPANEQYLRGAQGYGVPDGRTPGYTHKSDQDFIEQRKAEQVCTENDPAVTEDSNSTEPQARNYIQPQAPDPELRGAVGPTGTGHDEA